MKQLLTLLCFLTITGASLSAQIEKGNIAIGGSGTIDLGLDGNNAFSFQVNPFLGKFITDKLLVGGNVGLGYFNSDFLDQWSISVGPDLRYYLSVNERFSPFLTSRFSYVYTHRSYSEPSIYDGGGDGYTLNLGIGGSLHLNEHVTLDLTALYYKNDSDLFADRNGIALRAGFSIFLNRNKE